jgi:hypothetical protein
MISEKIFKKLLKQVEKTKISFDCSCSKMTNFFQPYFKDEIYVDFQPSDGFVIVVGFSGSNELSNVETSHALKEIEIDPEYYIKCDW